MFLGLRTAVYHTPELDKARQWYASVLGFEPYFAEPFYVGFNVNGYELGLVPDSADGPPGPGGATPYWGVRDIAAAVDNLVKHGAAIKSPVQDVGGDIKAASVADPFGNVIGLIENPHFQLPK